MSELLSNRSTEEGQGARNAHATDNLRTQLDDSLRNLPRANGNYLTTLRSTARRLSTLKAKELGLYHRLRVLLSLLIGSRASDSGIDSLTRLVTLYPDKVLECATQDGELPGVLHEMVKREVAESWLGTTLRVVLTK